MSVLAALPWCCCGCQHQSTLKAAGHLLGWKQLGICWKRCGVQASWLLKTAWVCSASSNLLWFPLQLWLNSMISICLQWFVLWSSVVGALYGCLREACQTGKADKHEKRVAIYECICNVSTSERCQGTGIARDDWQERHQGFQGWSHSEGWWSFWVFSPVNASHWEEWQAHGSGHHFTFSISCTCISATWWVPWFDGQKVAGMPMLLRVSMGLPALLRWSHTWQPLGGSKEKIMGDVLEL